MEEVSTIVPPPTEQKSSRDVYCLRTAKNDCIAVAPIQQIFRKQTCGVSDYTHRHDNAPTLWGVKRYQLPWLQVLRMRKAVMEQGELGSQECSVAKDGLALKNISSSVASDMCANLKNISSSVASDMCASPKEHQQFRSIRHVCKPKEHQQFRSIRHVCKPKEHHHPHPPPHPPHPNPWCCVASNMCASPDVAWHRHVFKFKHVCKFKKF